ncbi:MAG: flagellar M-ring protein FliF [Labilithrix sp.]|nr:flagellar M-ring protein FliF [Labilithrix sp.]
MSDKRLIDSLPAPLRPWAEKATAWVKGLSRSARIFVVTTTLALAGLGGFFALRTSNPPYAVLYSNLDRDDAAAVVAKLKEMKVPYRIEADGAIIEVPEANARELRLELAGGGLPRGGAVGFESFDKMRLGATEFEQRILYRRALEGELARTIGTVAAVQTARVHLVLPEKSVFVSRNEPSSASIVLKLRGGRALGAGEVAGIVHLVSTSVGGLSPDRVAVVTTEGAVLHKPRRPGEDGSGDDDRASQARSLEATLEERARSMVEKVTGPGHVDVRVTVDVDPARVERVEDHYDPRQSALRSEERNVERSGEDVPVAGVPGAESNLPGGAARAAGADGGAPEVAGATPGATRESHTRNFEVDRVTEKRTIAGGALRRVTVAVVIDGSPVAGGAPRSKEEIEKIAGLVRSAVGFDERRGDAVTVEAVPFLVGEAPEAPAPSATPAWLEPKKIAPFAGGALALIVLLSAVLVVRARSRRRKASAALALVAAKEKASAEAVTVELLAEGADKPESPDDLRRLVRERAALDPATAALVVRSWLGQHEAVREDAA